jgi:hypothetical protein
MIVVLGNRDCRAVGMVGGLLGLVLPQIVQIPVRVVAVTTE